MKDKLHIVSTMLQKYEDKYQQQITDACDGDVDLIFYVLCSIPNHSAIRTGGVLRPKNLSIALKWALARKEKETA